MSPKCWAIVAQISNVNEQLIADTFKSSLSANASTNMQIVMNLAAIYQGLLQKVPRRNYTKVTQDGDLEDNASEDFQL